MQKAPELFLDKSQNSFKKAPHKIFFKWTGSKKKTVLWDM